MNERIEEILDIAGSEHLANSYGGRFLGWYFSFEVKEKSTLQLKNGLTYEFDVCDFNYKFIMPSKIEFNGGLITYVSGERLLGVFRFPRDSEGNFVAPIHLRKQDLTLNITDEEAKKMLSMKKPLVFEAFKIPQFGFNFIHFSGQDLDNIENITDREYAKQLKSEWDLRVQTHINEVLEKVKALPNFLLILQNTLNKKIGFDEVEIMSNQIIHI